MILNPRVTIFLQRWSDGAMMGSKSPWKGSMLSSLRRSYPITNMYQITCRLKAVLLEADSGLWESPWTKAWKTFSSLAPVTLSQYACFSQSHRHLFSTWPLGDRKRITVYDVFPHFLLHAVLSFCDGSWTLSSKWRIYVWPPPPPPWVDGWGTDLQWEFFKGWNVFSSVLLHLLFLKKMSLQISSPLFWYKGTDQKGSLWRSGIVSGLRVIVWIIIWVITDLSSVDRGTNTEDWSQKAWVWGLALPRAVRFGTSCSRTKPKKKKKKTNPPILSFLLCKMGD